MDTGRRPGREHTMSASPVSALGYVVLGAADVDAWNEFGESILGLQGRIDPDGNGSGTRTAFLRADRWSWRIAIEEGEDNKIHALGFEMRNPAAFDELRATLEAEGFEVKVDPELAVRREVQALMSTLDPCGVPLEFFYGAKGATTQFVSPRGVEFVTDDMGIGHAVGLIGDDAAALRFYVDLLKFRFSDIVVFPNGDKAYFTSPNRRHHSYAFAPVPGGGVALEHIMLEVAELESVGRALDLCNETGVPIRETLGMHTNDHMVSFYCLSPSGTAIEYGWNGRLIDDDTHVTGYYDADSYWGHKPTGV